MSTITLSEAKAFLDVIHSGDDDKLQGLLDGAEHEALDYMNIADFWEINENDTISDDPSESGAYGMPANVRTGVLFLLQSVYQASVDERIKLRAAAETLLSPHRVKIGV